MNLNNIISETTKGLTTIIINRPSKLNALNEETIYELHQAFKTAEQDRNTFTCQRLHFNMILLLGFAEGGMVG